MKSISIPEILLPSECVDMETWAVNACDQYTSDEAYWRNVEKITEGKISTYNLIFPEIYLKQHPAERIARINSDMRAYLSGGVFKNFTGGFILVERTTRRGTRRGIVLAIDLEDYSFRPEDKALIRSTEATILERIPPRVEIRKNAPIELPHVMLLYDDEKNTVISRADRGEVLYDFDLMCGGGRVRGTYIKNPEEVIEAFYSLTESKRTYEKYGADDKLLFAVGDGNHSLATAKTCWEAVKASLSEEERKNHPARYALAEAVNVYDPALCFEPIHRLVKTDKADLFFKGLKTCGDKKAYIVSEGIKSGIAFNSDVPEGIRSLDAYIGQFISEYGGEADYIHGEEELTGLARGGNVGIILPAIRKDDFFGLIVNGGNLPKKTFSLGEGYEKRYYIEAKRIKP